MMTPRFAARLNTPFRQFMPYTFHHFDDAKWKFVYLPLNREYKPLGCNLKEHQEYDDFRGVAWIFLRDPHEFKDVWYDGQYAFNGPCATHPYLYNDDPNSRLDYFERLTKLMSYISSTYAERKELEQHRSRMPRRRFV